VHVDHALRRPDPVVFGIGFASSPLVFPIDDIINPFHAREIDPRDIVIARGICAAGVVRRQFFSWRELESRDYPVYIANLRDIGCPEQTIRDIIIADVNTLYTQRRANEMVTAESQWWRSEPDPAVVRAAYEKAKSLEDERRSLLTRLLGPNWESGDLVNLPRPSHPGLLLDGPVLGAFLRRYVDRHVEQRRPRPRQSSIRTLS
jgi:hypothetical protein